MDDDVFSLLCQISTLSHDDRLSDAEKISQIRLLLENRQNGELTGLKADLENELLEHSYKHRSLDDYMIGRNRWNRWNREKAQLLKRAVLTEFADPQ